MQETLRQRIGIDIGRKLPAEQAVAWAAAHGVRYFDIQCDLPPNAMERFDGGTAPLSVRLAPATACIWVCSRSPP